MTCTERNLIYRNEFMLYSRRAPVTQISGTAYVQNLKSRPSDLPRVITPLLFYETLISATMNKDIKLDKIFLN